MRATLTLFSLGLLLAPDGPAQSLSTGASVVGAYLQAAQADLDGENYQAAVTELQKAIALQPELRGAYYQLGFALFQMHEEHESEKAFRKELTFEPPDPYSLYYLGRIKANLGQVDEAISFYERTVS